MAFGFSTAEGSCETMGHYPQNYEQDQLYRSARNPELSPGPDTY